MILVSELRELIKEIGSHPMIYRLTLDYDSENKTLISWIKLI